jgi:hypothetical protein
VSGAQRRWRRLSACTQALLATSPDETETLDFKENINPLTDEYLTAMANAAALRQEPYATVLVGVAEAKDAKTGTTSGRIVGVGGDLHKAAETIAQRASNTRPTPIRILIFEENVSSRKPILRVEITPTSPPHFDQRGRRATRQHTTTRAMSDEEILQLLEAREQRRFVGVAEDTANLMMGRFRVVSEEMVQTVERGQWDAEDAMKDVLRRFENFAEDVGGLFDELWRRIDQLEMQLDDLAGDMDPADPNSMEHIVAALAHQREVGLMAAATQIGRLTDRDIEALDRVVNSPLDALAYTRNRRELQAWSKLLEVMFKDEADISAVVGDLDAAHNMGDESVERSVRDYAARLNRERRAAVAPPGKKPRTRD